MKIILVIEDDRTIREHLLIALKCQEFYVLGAEDGKEGIKKAQAVHPDLILCDVCMPYFDGHEVLQMVRQDPQMATTPFIFLTSQSSYADIRHGMNLGADDYLVKPFLNCDLLNAITACLCKQANRSRGYRDQVNQYRVALKKAANWDILTDLPNTKLFRQQLQQLCNRAQQESIHLPSVAVLSVKVTCYRTITLTFGREVGDRLLQLVGDRLQMAASPGLVARLGENEFGIAIFDAGDQEEMREFTQTLLDIVNVPYGIHGKDVRIATTVGIALFPHHGSRSEDLLVQANAAMRWCRQQTDTDYRFYNPAMAAMEAERHLMFSDLSNAIERSELELYYQPQVELATGRMTGMEALVRWNHPDRGLVSPDSFVNLAEESGLILPLGEWVLRTACTQAAQWARSGRPPVTMSVNLSMRQFQQRDLSQQVAEILAETGLDPKLLVLELTESCLMDQVSATVQRLRDLKRLGMKIAIDDFGTGYSSLSYLSQLPIDELKIDRSFVQNLHRDRNATMISSAIITMARSLHLKVVAEGIETQDQLNFLRHSGCHLVQGYLYAPPLQVADLECWWQAETQTIDAEGAAGTGANQGNPGFSQNTVKVTGDGPKIGPKTGPRFYPCESYLER
ncbi:MAG: EAL domain-containing protein [Alkalinema sp. FL-bin-369]|nr:EAL domain-containing protein [Leptolyngbyaceae cyanobacterium LF-bin-369]